MGVPFPRPRHSLQTFLSLTVKRLLPVSRRGGVRPEQEMVRGSSCVLAEEMESVLSKEDTLLLLGLLIPHSVDFSPNNAPTSSIAPRPPPLHPPPTFSSMKSTNSAPDRTHPVYYPSPFRGGLIPFTAKQRSEIQTSRRADILVPLS